MLKRFFILIAVLWALFWLSTIAAGAEAGIIGGLCIVGLTIWGGLYWVIAGAGR